MMPAESQEILVKYVHAIPGDPDLSDEWHVFNKGKLIGVMFSEEWAGRIAAGLELLSELSKDMGKTMDSASKEVLSAH